MTDPRARFTRVTKWFGLDVPEPRLPIDPELLPPPPPPREMPRPGTVVMRREATQPLVVPAKGGGLVFQLIASHVWTSDGLLESDLLALTGRHYKEIQRDVQDWARIVAADYPPHHVAEMQAAIDARFATEMWSFDTGDVKVSCTVRLRVVPDELVREQVADYWIKLIAMENKYDLDMVQARRARELTDEWAAIVEGLQGNPATANAALLAEQELVALLQRLAKEQGEVL